MFDDLFSGYTLFFSVPAVAGTVFFAIRLIMMFIGLGGIDGDFDIDHGVGDLHAAGGDSHHSSELFKILSIQSIASFLMGFGWGGLGGWKGMNWEFGTSLLAAVGGGVALVWLLSWLLKLVHDLQSSGTININAAVGAEGDVYVTVPESGRGTGQVRVVIDNRQRMYNAITEGIALPSNTRVRVTKANDDNTLTVTGI